MIQQKFEAMRVAKILSSVAVILALAVSGNVSAQTTLPETPSELRNFRLDPVPRRPVPVPQPEPEPAQSTTPPPVTERRAERPSREPNPPPERVSDRAPSTPQADAAPTGEGKITTPDEPVPEAAETAETVPAVPEAVKPAEPVATSVPVWQIAVGLGLLSLLLLVGFALRRKRKTVDPDAAQPELSSSEPAASTSRVVAAPPQLQVKTPPAAPTPADPPAPSLQVTLQFVPEKAVISFTALSIKGQLRLRNDSDIGANAMHFRAGLLSASEGQAKLISQFHSADGAANSEALGDIGPGELKTLSVELSVPLADMQSYAVGDQKLLIPIMVASLSYRADGEDHVHIAKLACMIGREANPPTHKMGPLRLDKGPRSFGSLGQRPVHA